MAATDIIIKGAREHNLRDVSLRLPRGKLICLTGVSGSGKSSLAFDTLYAEGQRRYVESLSSYARQFLGQLPKPDVDRIDGLSPSIAIQQKTGGKNPRSTVGTITEIHDFLRVLYARVGQGMCPNCGRPVEAQSREQIIARILELPAGTPFSILSPLIRGQKGEYKDLFQELARGGFVRARVDGEVISLASPPRLERQIKHDIELVIDRLKADPTSRPRLAEAVESALFRGEGTVVVAPEGAADILLSSKYACASCGIGFDPPSPQLFSFNNPQGMCTSCDGLGLKYDFDPEKLVPDPSLSLWNGAIEPLGKVSEMGRWRKHLFEGLAANLEAEPGGPARGTMLKSAWKTLPEHIKNIILHGSGGRKIVYHWKNKSSHWSHAEPWPGVAVELLDRYKGAQNSPAKASLDGYMRSMVCPDCKGSRLNARARAVLVGGKNLVDLMAMPISDALAFIESLSGGPRKSGGPAVASPLDSTSLFVATELLKEIRARMGFLVDVGLDYLSLDRPAPTLSGGEAQRIRLASQVGAGLVGVLYILDEPSIGLHPRDNERLLSSLEKLRDLGNTVIVVEHDEDTMRAADLLVDFGPGPGVRGGEVVASGSISDLAGESKSVTGQYLSGARCIATPRTRRKSNGKALEVIGARHNNLKNIDVSIPLGLFVCFTGVSGSGKSSLVGDILRESLARDLNKANGDPGLHDSIKGVEHLDKLIDIDQSPIGRTPRSNPATYIKLFDLIRDLFTQLPEAKTRGFKPGRFSFNVEGGRCEACGGNGSNRLEMDFLADVWVTCPVCEGKRFNRETLHVRFKGKSISDVLDMDVQEALEHFENVPKIKLMLQTLHDVGLDYLKLGQASPTLSGGEAQRIKLARELVKRSTGKTLYLLDEPTTGLHFADVGKLIEVLQGFANAGNTVIVIEHNLDVVKTADWIIDLGPEGGQRGGMVVAEGTPEEVAKVAASHTGRALKKMLGKRGSAQSSNGAPKNGKAATKASRASSESGLKSISILGASQNNLKSVDVEIPREKFTVCSGPSGSGKTSLAIDTLYAEGQRRYVESLSSYARQFLTPLQKPRVEKITGLSPSICIEQKTTARSPRSTVSTVTEIHDYLRVLMARLGRPHCPDCGVEIGVQTADEIIDKVLQIPEGSKVYIMAPIERREGADFNDLWQELKADGFARVRVDGVSHNLESPPELSRRGKHTIEVVVDRAVVRRSTRSRLADSIESALDLGKGVVHVALVGEESKEARWPVQKHSQHRTCESCGRSFDELTPHNFSFNSPLGWCPLCQGLGVQQGAEAVDLVPDGSVGIRHGAVAPWPDFGKSPMFAAVLEAVAGELGFSLDEPFETLEARYRRIILQGAGDRWFKVESGASWPSFSVQFKGLIPSIDEATRTSYIYRWKLQGMVTEAECTMCMGERLRDDASAVKFHGSTLAQISRWPLGKTLAFFRDLVLKGDEKRIAGDVILEIVDRLRFLVDVGLDYLTLARRAPTLSGGESQRIRLASQIGSGLTGVLYVLDEPTIGLHPRDNARLLKALQRLRDLGNTLVVVEHDREVIEAADHLIDFGPGAGEYGGRITASASPAKVKAKALSLTGQYLAGKLSIPIPANRRPTDGQAIVVQGARRHNLKNIAAKFPVGVITAVTGVSGSGKSSLVEDVLLKGVSKHFRQSNEAPGAHQKILGLSAIDKVVSVDQSPIGATPASNPATYTGAFDLIREVFARLPESKLRGYSTRRFSFNQAGGRCEACEGAGQKRIEMHFLPDVWVTCEICQGKRYTPETLAVKFREKTIADVLEMNVDSAVELFRGVPKLRRVLTTLRDVGLGYVSLGQSATTLSGGEAQRVKLAGELSKPQTGRTLYILDEPTTGLHADDVGKLLQVLHRLADLGNTIVVVEHQLDVVKSADWVLDLGPEAGDAGGTIVVEGTPEELAACKNSHTGKALAPILGRDPYVNRIPFDPKAAALAELEIDQKAKESEAKAPKAKAPWEIDGRTWHTKTRFARNGQPIRWDGGILEHIVDRIEAHEGFEPTDWNARTLVKVYREGFPGSLNQVFFEAATSLEWVVVLRFSVPAGVFQFKSLSASLALEPFELSPTPVLSNMYRMTFDSKTPGLDVIAIACHSLADIKNERFNAFLDRAVSAFVGEFERSRPRLKILNLGEMREALASDSVGGGAKSRRSSKKGEK